MKKILVLLGMMLFLVVLGGCSFLMASPTSELTFMTQTTTTQSAISDSEVDISQLLDDLYARIYEEIYDQVRDEVIADLSLERFNQIYADVIQDVFAKIDSEELTLTPESVIEKLLSVVQNQANAVIGVSNLNDLGVEQSIGSGVIYKKTGDMYYAVTNNHVVEDGHSFAIRFADDTTVPAELIGVDETSDLAVLRFTTTKDLPVVAFGDSDNLQSGTIILAVGHPNGYDFYNSVTFGIVSGTNRYFDINNDDVKDMFVGYIQHDAAINSGNSGGALFNLEGEVVGINVIKIASTEIEGMGFAIPGSLAQAIVSDIEEFGYSKQIPGVGIQFSDISQNRDYLIGQGIAIPEGITVGFYIIEVTPGSSVDGYVLPGDIILEIGDIVITSSYYFSAEFSKYHVGDLIEIVVYRDGATLTLTDIELKPKVS